MTIINSPPKEGYFVLSFGKKVMIKIPKLKTMHA
jgi:hypothetical protein